MQAITFYRVRDPWGEFSNFAPFPITIDGTEWPTSEHYFQAQKFADLTQQEVIRTAASPKEAAQMGRDRSRPLRDNWEQIKDDVMRAAVRASLRNTLN